MGVARIASDAPCAAPCAARHRTLREGDKYRARVPVTGQLFAAMLPARCVNTCRHRWLESECFLESAVRSWESGGGRPGAELMDTPKAPRPSRYTSFHEETPEVRAVQRQWRVRARTYPPDPAIDPYDADAAAKLALQSWHPAGAAASIRGGLDVRGGPAARDETAAQGWRGHLEVSQRSTARAVPVD